MKTKDILIRLSVFLAFLLVTNCVQEVHMKTVTFRVDTRETDTITGIGIRGNFTTPPWEQTVPLIDEDQDGIYELQVSQKTAANQTEFKFVDQNGAFELTGQNNRVLHFEYKPETLLYTTRFNNPKGKQIDQSK